MSTIDFCNYKSIPGLIVSFDFQIAFDKVEWDSLELILKWFGFGPVIISMILLCYNNIESTVINNGFTSRWFSLSRSVRQGDPISSLCFNLVVEVLGVLIRNNQQLEGAIPGKRKLHPQYADDIWAAIVN